MTHHTKAVQRPSHATSDSPVIRQTKRGTDAKKRRLARTLAVGFVALGITLSGCRPTTPTLRQPPVVRVAPAKIAPAGHELRLSGTIEPDRSIPLSFAVAGTLCEVLVAEGTVVEQGQILARLDTQSLTNALAIALAKTDQAQDAFRRMEPMHKNRTIPEIKWIQVETDLRQTQHALALARKNLEDAVLRAPEAGVISKRSAECGANMAPGQPAFILVQNRIVLATAALPEREVHTAQIGQSASVRVGALQRSFSGIIREIAVTADPLTRTFPIKIALDNREGALRVGMVADVFLHQKTSSRIITVDPEAVRLDEKGATCVYVLSNGVVKRRPVKVSGYCGERIALVDGLEAGSQVVISGTPMLSDGVQVRVQQSVEEK